VEVLLIDFRFMRTSEVGVGSQFPQVPTNPGERLRLEVSYPVSKVTLLARTDGQSVLGGVGGHACHRVTTDNDTLKHPNPFG
jgi:hypothetical protein